jgi:hypothetical protein
MSISSIIWRNDTLLEKGNQINQKQTFTAEIILYKYKTKKSSAW